MTAARGIAEFDGFVSSPAKVADGTFPRFPPAIAVSRWLHWVRFVARLSDVAIPNPVTKLLFGCQRATQSYGPDGWTVRGTSRPAPLLTVSHDRHRGRHDRDVADDRREDPEDRFHDARVPAEVPPREQPARNERREAEHHETPVRHPALRVRLPRRHGRDDDRHDGKHREDYAGDDRHAPHAHGVLPRPWSS